MCFYHDDGDWYAAVCEDDHFAPTDNRTKCKECRRVIHAGQWRRHVHMRQYECCRVCDPDTQALAAEENGDDEVAAPPAAPCPDGKHDYGETFDCDICEECQKLLAAIESVEADDGCTGPETQPAFGWLREAFTESEHAEEYIERAQQDYPELAISGHLDRFNSLISR